MMKVEFEAAKHWIMEMAVIGGRNFIFGQLETETAFFLLQQFFPFFYFYSNFLFRSVMCSMFIYLSTHFTCHMIF